MGAVGGCTVTETRSAFSLILTHHRSFLHFPFNLRTIAFLASSHPIPFPRTSQNLLSNFVIYVFMCLCVYVFF